MDLVFFQFRVINLSLYSLQLRWGLGLVSADDEEREEDGEQTATVEEGETLTFRLKYEWT